MKKYDTVIFDLDGTLLNTLEDLTDSVNAALARYGFPARKAAEVRQFAGNGVARLIALSIPDGTDNPRFQECLADFRSLYAKNMQNKTKPYPGIPTLLRQLSDRHYKLAIVSNKFDQAVKGLNRTYFDAYIKIAIGESEHIAKKPAPDAVYKALEELGSTPDRAVYVGDSEVDVQTAKNAGMVCVGVTWGFRDRAVLEREGADHRIDRPEELLDLVSD